MNSDAFCIFILTHKRASDILTLRTLNEKVGIYSNIYLLVSDDDDDLDIYKSKYGNMVITFSKDDVSKYTDTGSSPSIKQTPLYARNIVHEKARNLGFNKFIVLDDDYYEFSIRYNVNDVLNRYKILDKETFYYVANLFFSYFDIDERIKTVCFAQGGDLIGGVNGQVAKSILQRKAMNTFFCRTDRPFRFVGALNDDVSTYTTLSSRGDIFLTNTLCAIEQRNTQQSSGGLTETYLKYNTYNKSMFTVIMGPSFTKISAMQTSTPRIHHTILKNNVYPKIISYKYKK